MIEVAVILVLIFVVVGCAVYRMTGNFALDDLWEFLRTRWWGLLICALLFWAIAALKYWRVSHGYVFGGWRDWIMYSMFGKWGSVFVWGFFGALFTFVGIWNLVVRICYGKSDDE